MRRALLSLCMLTGSAACATTSAVVKKQWTEEAAHPLRCEGPAACEKMWADAVRWIQDNSHWKIRTATDILLTTEGPERTVLPAYEVSKYPLGGGAYEIRFRAGCYEAAGFGGCSPSVLEVTASFTSALLGRPHAKKG